VDAADSRHSRELFDKKPRRIKRKHGTRAGNPAELGQQYRRLLEKLGNLKVLGGCCGTDFRHIEAICEAAVVRG
jgi:methionine synthase I (cobalamin-dependent)